MSGYCNFCNKFRFVLEHHEIMTQPGGGRIYKICRKCISEGRLPKSFNERYGISSSKSSEAKFVKFIGVPEILYGTNAYGSVLAENDDGSKISVICGHGGSAWLCFNCARKVMNQQEDLE